MPHRIKAGLLAGLSLLVALLIVLSVASVLSSPATTAGADAQAARLPGNVVRDLTNAIPVEIVDLHIDEVRTPGGLEMSVDLVELEGQANVISVQAYAPNGRPIRHQGGWFVIEIDGRESRTSGAWGLGGVPNESHLGEKRLRVRLMNASEQTYEVNGVPVEIIGTVTIARTDGS